jgi:hypothetical protein
LALLAFYADRLEDLVYKMFPLDIWIVFGYNKYKFKLRIIKWLIIMKVICIH